jgi:raffinose/stachyose/melibiose transport system substrate-binding protein
MMMDGSWGVKYFLSMVQDFEFGLVEFPNLGATKVALPLALGFTVGVNAKTKNPEAAAEFLDWLVDNPRQAVLNGVAYYEFWLPIIKGTPEMLPGTIDRRAGDLYKIFYQAQSSGKFGYTTWTFFPARTQTFMYENLPRVLHGELSIEDYLKQAQSTFEKDYAEGKVMSVPKPNL